MEALKFNPFNTLVVKYQYFFFSEFRNAKIVVTAKRFSKRWGSFSPHAHPKLYFTVHARS